MAQLFATEIYTTIWTLPMRKEGCFLDFISFMKDENGVDLSYYFHYINKGVIQLYIT